MEDGMGKLRNRSQLFYNFVVLERGEGWSVESKCIGPWLVCREDIILDLKSLNLWWLKRDTVYRIALYQTKHLPQAQCYELLATVSLMWLKTYFQHHLYCQRRTDRRNPDQNMLVMHDIWFYTFTWKGSLSSQLFLIYLRKNTVSFVQTSNFISVIDLRCY